MAKTKVKKEPDFRFEEVGFKCKCGKEGKEFIPVAENTGVLDTRCSQCGRRILEIRIFDSN